MAEVPARIARLPKDARGIPIPWNTLCSDDGKPFFAVNDDRKHFRAIRNALCPICGETLGRWKWFVGGPRSAFDEHGWYMDLPTHHECAQFALANCPYLSAPVYLKRIDIPDPSKLPAPVLLDETQIPDRPELFVAVASVRVELRPRGALLPYVRPTRPALAYEYWRHGVQLSREEGIAAVRVVLGADWTEPPTTEATNG